MRDEIRKAAPRSAEDEAWHALVARVRDLELIDGVRGLLGWDEATRMPKEAAPLRGRQQALLSAVAHRWLCDDEVGRLLRALEGTTDPVRAACLRNVGRAHHRARCVPETLVDEMAKASSEAFATWLEAKAARDVRPFLPHLSRMRTLCLRRAEHIDPHRHPYEVTLEEFDPGTTLASVRDTFARLRNGLTPLLAAIAQAPMAPPPRLSLPLPVQEALNRRVAEALGYRFAGGCLDAAEHPFSSGLGEGDVRITTHLYEDDVLAGLYGTIHEVGHALYEQGLPHREGGTSVAQAAGYALHESQSRFWENYIGRSESFCAWLSRLMEADFGLSAAPDELFRALNRVHPGPIRVQADEVTYNLHIIIRFELEFALLDGQLRAEEMPEAWGERYQSILGVAPEHDADGVLQDVHWAAAGVGYFPSYTLGNLYAASLGAALEQEQSDLFPRVEQGDFEVVLTWLRKRIHDVGHLYEAPEIMRRCVGERDHVEDLLQHVWRRHGALYGAAQEGAAQEGAAR